MPFKYIVDEEKNIVVLKARGEISLVDVIAEIQKAINTKRGDGITRRLVDITEQDITFSVDDARKIVKMIKVSANVLGSEKVAVLLKKIPSNLDLSAIQSDLSSPTVKIKLFTDKAKAAAFLNAPSRVVKKR